MTTATIATLTYLGTTLAVTLIVGNRLHRHGRPFLRDVFRGNPGLADAVNHLLLVGFYLMNIALPLVLLREPVRVREVLESVELFSELGGMVLVILGMMHLVNVAVLDIVRRLVRNRATL